MRTAAVIRIAGAHDARNAAFRLTMPVPDGSCRAGIPGSGNGDTVKASDGVTAGRPTLTRPGAAAAHPVTEQRHGRRRRPSLGVLLGACQRASAIAAAAAALDRGRRQLTPALLGVG